MKWSAQSPNLNFIENLREIVDRKEDLSKAVIREWHNISKETIDILIGLMHRRCAVVIKNKGYRPKY